MGKKTATEAAPVTSATLRVKLFSEFKTFYEGEARSISSVNSTGPFDVLPGHANFITILQNGYVRIQRPTGDSVEMDIERGVMHVNSDAVTVFLDV